MFLSVCVCHSLKASSTDPSSTALDSAATITKENPPAATSEFPSYPVRSSSSHPTSSFLFSLLPKWPLCLRSREDGDLHSPGWSCALRESRVQQVFLGSEMSDSPVSNQLFTCAGPQPLNPALTEGFFKFSSNSSVQVSSALQTSLQSGS